MEEIRLLMVHPDPETLLAISNELRQHRPSWWVRSAHTVELIESWLRVVRPDAVVVPARQRNAVRGVLVGHGLLEHAPPCLVPEEAFWRRPSVSDAITGLLLRLDLVVASRSPWREAVSRKTAG